MRCLALYLRLSIEDEDDRDESNSIGNQRKQIDKYIQQDRELCKYERKEFCDDGYSGTSMERPGMQKLQKEIKENKIQCIIVKDMSRFSRDYIELGTWLNRIFPFMGIRFIALNDSYDSRKCDGGTIEFDTAFQTLLYDLYSKDLSVKVKASVERKCADGEYVFGQVPFGYKKSEEEKNAIVVNEREAVVVRRIFSLAVQGKSSVQIAKQLQKENVQTVMQMRKPHILPKDGKEYAWSSAAIRNILNNRFYLGEMAYGKTAVKAVGSKKHIACPKEEWKVIMDHHEAMVTPEVYEQVSLFGQKNSTRRRREKHPLTGKLYCGGCRYAMVYRPLREKNHYRRFECYKHSLLGNLDCCTYFSADILEEIVFFMLNRELMHYGNAMKQKDNLASFQTVAIDSLKKKLAGYETEKKALQKEKDMLYEKYASEQLQGISYREAADEITERISDLTAKESESAGEISRLEEEYGKLEDDMKKIIRYVHLIKLTQESADTFIKKIYVYKGKRVEIEWNFSLDCGGAAAKQT